MERGQRVGPSPPLAKVREYASQQLASLPPPLRSLDTAAPYRVEVAPALRELARQVDEREH
jgi:hypothetical protein